MRNTTFTDKLGSQGNEGDQIILAVPGESAMDFPQLEVATVIDVITQEPSPFGPAITLRVRISADDESIAIEPHEVIVLTGTWPMSREVAIHTEAAMNCGVGRSKNYAQRTDRHCAACSACPAQGAAA